MNDHTTKVRTVVPRSQTPQATAYLNRILIEAREFERFAESRSRLSSSKVHSMALASVSATVSIGARSLIVPTKLLRVRETQDVLEAIVAAEANTVQRLSVVHDAGRIWVLFGDRRLGHIWEMHGWAWPLTSAGSEIYLSRVTGGDEPWQLFGCNVFFARVIEAIRRVEGIPVVPELRPGQGDGADTEPDWPAVAPRPALR